MSERSLQILRERFGQRALESSVRLGSKKDPAKRGRALELANDVSKQAPLAVNATLNSARHALQEGASAAAGQFGKIQKKLLASDDFQEGLRSFKSKRAAQFSGN